MSADRVGSPLGQAMVRSNVSALVRMALDEGARLPVRDEPCGHSGQIALRCGTEVGPVRVEVGDDERTRHVGVVERP